MAVMTPTGITATVISRVSTTVPQMAGKMPPPVIPFSGAVVRNSHESLLQPPSAASPTMTTRMASSSTTATPVRPEKIPEVARRTPGERRTTRLMTRLPCGEPRGARSPPPAG